ncbi:MAG: hypothetical protein H6861_06615 [Rhodospirillales bacterium]|nr:hypothetical protein [Rhodospirillales bacterium]
MTTKIQNLIILACAIFLLALPARAETVTEEGAGHLQTLFQNLLDARAQKDAHVAYEGKVTVEPAETYYAITWPAITLNSADGEQVKIGLIAMNAAPHDKPGQYKVTTALPSPIIGHDAAGVETLNVTIGGQHAAGIFDETLGNFIKMDVRLENIRILLDGGKALAKIPALFMRYDLSEDERGRFSGPSHFEISDLTLSQAENSQNLSLEKFIIAGTIKGLDAQALRALPENTEAPQSPLKLSNAASMTLSVKNLQASTPSQTQSTNGFSLQSASLGFTYENVLSGTATASTMLSFHGLNPDGLPENIRTLLPTTGSLNLTQHNIPVDAIQQTLQNSASLLSLPLLFKLPAILAQAGSYVEIKDTGLQNDEYSVDLSSHIRADLTALNSATASGTLRFAGLDKLLARAQVIGSDIHASSYAMPVRSLARFLERLKPLGRVETDAEKGFVHIFDLKLDAAGKFTINDQNAGALFNKELSPLPAAPKNAPENPL